MLTPAGPCGKRRRLLLELPLLATHRTDVAGLLRVQPLHDAVYVETMRALPPDKRTIVSWNLAIRTAGVKRHPAYAAIIVVGDPTPGGDACPTFDRDFHFRRAMLRKCLGNANAN